MLVDLARDLLSVGHLCGSLQTLPRSIEVIANELGIVPAVRINGVAHFDGNQAEQIAERIRQQRGEKP